MSAPYKTTPVFDETSLPLGLQKEHRTKEGVFGLIRVLEGAIALRILEPPSEVQLTPQRPGLVLPAQPHELEVLRGVTFKLRVEFYTEAPST